MQIAFRDLPVLDNAGSTRNFEFLQAALNPVWIEPLFEHAWKNFGGEFTKAAYCKDLLGWVHIRGLIVSGENEKSAFTLPVGFRPFATERCPANYNGGTLGWFDVRSSGLVIPFNTAKENINLTTINFRAER